MSMCSGHPPPAEERKALQVREPSEGAPSATTQGLHGLRKVKKITFEQVNNTQNYKGHSGAKKAPKASSPWASSLVKARLTKDSKWGSPRAMESSRGLAPFKIR